MILWKNNQTTLQVLKKVKDEIQETKDEVVDGGLMVSPALEREYCRSIGYLRGLEFIEGLLEIGENDG